ncbi:MAG TPA: dihydrodipicolinate synthase family protein [Blastocatellia bacterium]|nr:dihydrodipicolinate synthase family protein [Blastocatellia bacterium]
MKTEPIQADDTLPASRGRTASSIYQYQPRRGLSIPSITVLDRDGRVIEEQQRRVFRFDAQQGYGADIIFGVGTNGEWNRISNGERQRLIWIETDEVRRINSDLTPDGLRPVEAWVGVTSSTCEETLANIECAIEAGADAAVIAPLSIRDLTDITTFFQRDVSDLFDHLGAAIPIFLYDNADIAADPRIPHIRTRDVKRLSRLPFVFGLKVSAPRRVLGNYTRGALHYKDKGGFGIYVGDAMLMFQVFRLEDGFIGRAREYWNRYLLHNELPAGVVSGPANVFPREWQRAWRACYAGDERLMAVYKSAFERFAAAYRFDEGGKAVKKTIACLKHALRIEGVIDSDLVAEGTRALTDGQRAQFAERLARLKEDLAKMTDPIWLSRVV